MVHIPVLRDAVMQYLAPQKGDSYLDVTAGYGGHARELANISQGRIVLVDRDTNALEYVQQVLPEAELVHDSFGHYTHSLDTRRELFDVILADIGVSSPHLDNRERGFSYQQDGPLDMRMDQSTGQTAADLINSFSTAELADILRKFGEEPRSKLISQKIKEQGPVTTTAQLRLAVESCVPGHHRMSTLSRVFQALRIAVNSELNELQELLVYGPRILKPGGRLGIICFHSLEDRMVKQAFAEIGGDRYDTEFLVLTGSPVTAGAEEVLQNPRARSAKLRVLQRKK
jgi:16S rRNA (cytosine1402-N4)-methyltransferase